MFFERSPGEANRGSRTSSGCPTSPASVTHWLCNAAWMPMYPSLHGSVTMVGWLRL